MSLRSFFCLGVLLITLNAHAFTDFSKTSFRFLGLKEAGLFLATPDDFTRALTPLDLSLHHSTPTDVAIDDHLRFLGQQALEWSSEEVKLIEGELLLLENAINGLGLTLRLPQEVLLVKTSGEEEYHAHYTRGAAIIFPIESTSQSVKTDAATVFHELFHVFSRFNPELHDDLYSVCNFHRTPEVVIPSSLASLELTNPDAFLNQHYVEVISKGQQARVVPFIYSALRQDQIIPPVNEALTFKLGLLDIDRSTSEIPVFYSTRETDYAQRTLANSRYIIHPEEIMAENFRLLLMRQAGMPIPNPLKHPEALDRLQALLARQPGR